MKAEIEAKFTDIDKEQLRKQLRAIGATLVKPERMMTRAVFDGHDEGTYYRVRNEGDQITMSVKRLNERSISGMQEICLNVDSYDNAVEFISKLLNAKPKAEQETLRESWVKDGVEIDIDTWPWIPSFVEIEGPNAASVQQIASELGFNMIDAKYGSVEIVYLQHYDVTEEEVDAWPEIKFTDTVPDWLEAKRIKQ